MSIKRWMYGLCAAVVMTTAASSAMAETPDPGWSALVDHAVVVVKQDGSVVEGKLVVVQPPFVAVLTPDGSRAFVDRSMVKTLRARLGDEQVTVTMKENGATFSGKLAESDAKTLVVVTDDGRRVALERASIKSVRERFSPQPATAPPPAGGTDGGEHAGDRPDAVRARVGISAMGGFVYASSSQGSALAPVVGFSGRLGVQVNHLFSVYYQNTGVVLIAGGGVGFFDYNSFLVNVTAAHMLDVGVGPSADVFTVSPSGGASATAVAAGLHGRLAVNIGGASGWEPRRTGLSLGIDVHPSFGSGGVIVTTAASIGYEWF